MIHIKNISLHIKRKNILNNISCSIKNGTCTAIIGQNGAGKTCLLKTIIKQIIPTAGSIQLTGTIGYCPDKPALYEELTAREQRKLTTHIANYPYNTQKAQQYIENMELQKFIDIPIKALSQGNKQKVSLINSIIHHPTHIIWDEPTQHLDPQARIAVHTIMQDQKQQGRTILYTTHFLEDLGIHTDNYILLYNGYIEKHEPYTKNTQTDIFS